MKLSPILLATARLICDGKNNDEIASAFDISPHGVKWRIREIMRQLGARDRANIAARIAAAGLWKPPSERAETEEMQALIAQTNKTLRRRRAKGKRTAMIENPISMKIRKITPGELAREGVFEIGAVTGTQVAYVVTEERIVILHRQSIDDALCNGWRTHVGALRPIRSDVHHADRGNITPGYEHARTRASLFQQYGYR